MRVLTDEGLLRHEAHRGVFVPHLTRADVEDLFILRTALEVEAATLAARRKLDLAEAEERSSAWRRSRARSRGTR